MKYKNCNAENKKAIKEFVFDSNVKIASIGLLGFAVKKLVPSKENLRKFQLQFDGHPMCGCYSCVELAKTFVISSPDIKESVITESMNELDGIDWKY